MELGDAQKAMEFIRLDAGSEWAARQTALLLMGQGKPTEALQSIQKTSDVPLMARDFVRACLDPQRRSELDRETKKIEAATLAGVDPEPRYWTGAMLSYCGQKEASLRLLRSAIEHNYCGYTALQNDPLLVKLRKSREFRDLLSAAKDCQDRFLAQQDYISR
jgi:hypothetical protein